MTDETTLEHPVYSELTIADIVRQAAVGDRVHIELTHREGRIPWHSDWVTDAGDDYFETDRFRVEITDPDAHGRGAVTLFESQGGDYYNESWTESLNGLERTPRSVFDEHDVYMWEIGVSEVRGGGVSTDKTVFPEAPSREAAEEAAKRWGEMESGYTTVVYQEKEITPPDADADADAVEA